MMMTPLRTVILLLFSTITTTTTFKYQSVNGFTTIVSSHNKNYYYHRHVDYQNGMLAQQRHQTSDVTKIYQQQDYGYNNNYNSDNNMENDSYQQQQYQQGSYYEQKQQQDYQNQQQYGYNSYNNQNIQNYNEQQQYHEQQQNLNEQQDYQYQQGQYQQSSSAYQTPQQQQQEEEEQPSLLLNQNEIQEQMYSMKRMYPTSEIDYLAASRQRAQLKVESITNLASDQDWHQISMEKKQFMDDTTDADGWESSITDSGNVADSSILLFADSIDSTNNSNDEDVEPKLLLF
jgi:hypothetical protein